MNGFQASNMEVHSVTSLREMVSRFTRWLDTQRSREVTDDATDDATDDVAIMESINIQTVCRRMAKVPCFFDLAATDVHHFMSVLGLQDTCDHVTAACVYRACYSAYRAHSAWSLPRENSAPHVPGTADTTNIQMRVYDVHDGNKDTPEPPKAESRGERERERDSEFDPSSLELELDYDFKKEIFEFYRRYAAHRLRKNGVNISQIAQKYEGQRDLLNKRLNTIYGTNLDTMAMRRRHPSSHANANVDIMDRLKFWSMPEVASDKDVEAAE